MPEISFRKLEKTDLPIRVEWMNNPNVSRFLGQNVRHGTTIEKQEEWYDRYSKDETREMFVILADGVPVGNVGLTDISMDDKNAGIFIVIGEESYWGKGIAKEAMNYITELGFGELKLHKLWLYVLSVNERAWELYNSLGFQEEGRLRDMCLVDGKYCDEIIMTKFNLREKE